MTRVPSRVRARSSRSKRIFISKLTGVIGNERPFKRLSFVSNYKRDIYETVIIGRGRRGQVTI